MSIYLVENDDAWINNWGCYWLVEASNAKEAIHKAYAEGNQFYGDTLRSAAMETGIFKRKLTATRVDKLLKNEPLAYMIA